MRALHAPAGAGLAAALLGAGALMGCGAAPVTSRTTYLVGGRSSLLVTGDGGIHWQPVRPVIGDTGGGTRQVFFFSRRDGIALADDGRNNYLPTIWRTTDGGRHWSSVTPRAG
jgi:photosystem II stability/assembly factor-like uncharacterized protein